MSALLALVLAAALVQGGDVPATNQPVADAPIGGVTGVWEGTLGTSEVMVCFEESKGFGDNGVYYDRKHLKPIPLWQIEKGSGVWYYLGGSEPEAWKITSQDGNTLTADWSRGEESAVIRLNRIDWGKGEARAPRPCSSREFSAPRTFTPVIKSERAVEAGFAYRKLTWVRPEHFVDSDRMTQIVTFELDPVEVGDAAINRELRSRLPDGSLDDYFMQCTMRRLSRDGFNGIVRSVYELEFANRRFLTVSMDDGGLCGGPHPDYWWKLQIFDRQTGRKIDPESSWFTEAGFFESDDGRRRIRPALRKIVMKNYSALQEGECREEAETAEFWRIGLIEAGLGFNPASSSGRAPCRDVVVVGWDELQPFLSAEGREVQASIGR